MFLSGEFLCAKKNNNKKNSLPFFSLHLITTSFHLGFRAAVFFFFLSFFLSFNFVILKILGNFSANLKKLVEF